MLVIKTYTITKSLKCKKIINKSITIDPSNSYAFKNRAIVYLAIGKKEAAHEDLIHAVNLGYEDYWGNEVNTLLDEHFKDKV